MNTTITPPGPINQPCGKWACGDHGECVDNVCVCNDFWSGDHCQNAPPVSVPPVTSSTQFHSEHGGDFQCGNWGTFGTVIANNVGVASTCNCGSINAMKGSRCHQECVSDADCGGIGRGTCDTDVFRCTCEFGWTGRKCHTADPHITFKCTSDSDCGWGGVVGGKCQTDGTCVCNSGFTGKRCETHLTLKGDPCSQDKDCVGYLDTCASGKCKATGSDCEKDTDCSMICMGGVCHEPDSPPEGNPMKFDELLMGLISFMASPEGIAMNIIQSQSEHAVEYAVTELLPQALQAGVDVFVTFIDDAVTAASEKGILAGFSETLMSTMLAQEAAERAVTVAAEEGTSRLLTEAMEILIGGPFGVVMAIQNMLQIVGMILDIGDAAGLNELVTQSYINLFMRKMFERLNTTPKSVENGILIPYEYLPATSSDYIIHMNSPDVVQKRIQLLTEYINALKVNSNGQPIVKLWHETPIDTHKSSALNSFLWSISNGSENTFNALQTYWWVILVVLVVVITGIGLAIGLPITIMNKKQKQSLKE